MIIKPKDYKPVTIRSQYDGTVFVEESPDWGPSLTQQNQKEETSIEYILEKYAKTGILETSQRAPQYGDFLASSSYHEALNLIKKANDQFASLSSEIRVKFDNDPAKFLEFCNDAKNTEEAIKLGIMMPPPEKVEKAAEKVAAKTE